jgi:hypothetical protein
LTLVQHDGQTMIDQRIPLTASRLWLRAECDYFTQLARFSYSTDGASFSPSASPSAWSASASTFQGVRYALFSFHRGQAKADLPTSIPSTSRSRTRTASRGRYRMAGKSS